MERIKGFVVGLLNHAVAAYIRRNNIRVVVVAGSIGKTSTAQAIRTVLSQAYKVHQPVTAYNTLRSIHIEMFDLPFATSTIGWLLTVPKVLVRTMRPARYQILVAEIGTDHPGELAGFAWLKPSCGVLTSIAPEHMEQFKTIQAVADEELTVASFCDTLFANANAIDRKLVPSEVASRITWYGESTDYRVDTYRASRSRVEADITIGDYRCKDVQLQVVGIHSLDAVVAAASVGKYFGMSDTQLSLGMAAIEPVKGRMQRLQGINGSLILDDSYNSSPEAARAGLDTLYGFRADQRVAILGSMNEMGDYSKEAHQTVGAYCDSTKLDLLVTVGQDANEYLAPAAEARGCHVIRCTDPYAAGKEVKSALAAQDAVVYVKGSQNGVFTEEAIKMLLENETDAAKLVRQSPFWLEQKRRQFGR